MTLLEVCAMILNYCFQVFKVYLEPAIDARNLKFLSGASEPEPHLLYLLPLLRFFNCCS